MKVNYTGECHPSPGFQGGKAWELFSHPVGLHDEAVCVLWQLSLHIAVAIPVELRESISDGLGK